MYTLQSGKQHAVAFSVALRGREGGATAELGDDLAGTLRASGGGGDKPRITAFSCKDYGGDASLDIAPTMRAMGHSGSHANAGGQLAVLTFNTTQITSPQNGANPKWGDPCFSLTAGNHPPAVCVTGDKTHALTAEGFDASEDGTGRGSPIVTYSEMAVRRLMPVEAERLQGFPGNWTLVPYGKRMAADGPRYKQLGNSWAVNCVAWIGKRIDDELRTISAHPVQTEHGIVWTTDAEIAWMTCP
jgi:DNA (cytosine-5)-methyltransferase 1